MCVQRILILGKGTASQTSSLEKKKDKKKKHTFSVQALFVYNVKHFF